MFLYNSLTRKKEKLIKKNVKMYVCGVTVYDRPHLGHALSTVTFDVLHRYLEYKGYKVTRVQNFTDVDDKIINKSKELNITAQEVADRYIETFFEDMDALGVRRADVHPRATEDMNEIIELISSLIDNKAAYSSNGSVYFDVSFASDYGKLSGRNIEEEIDGTRIENDPDKKNVEDFALWKKAPASEPHWKSPWGIGRPGWHIECSAMAKKHLGDTIDIHGGGLDLVFPHHENEIAQTCSNNSNDKMANYWVHNGFLTMNKEKMSKSLGNIVSITDALKHYNGQVLRLALLSSHYKQPLDWNEKLLDQQKNTLDKWYSLYEESYSQKKIPYCFESLLDDLNTPEYISKLHELYNEAFKGDKDKKETFNYACRLIGIFNENKKSWENYKKKSVKISEKNIINKINERLEARKKGDFKLADKIRIELLNEGVLIEDKKDKTNWKYK